MVGIRNLFPVEFRLLFYARRIGIRIRCSGRQALSRRSNAALVRRWPTGGYWRPTKGLLGEPLDKERSSDLLKSFPLYSLLRTAAREDCALSTAPDDSSGQAALGATGPDAPVVVLDTNVVLDWLVFRDPSCVALSRQLRARRWAWHATEAMRAELAGVLPRKQLLEWQPDCECILSIFDELTVISFAAQGITHAGMRPCRDPDDQKFVDLACAIGARWLFSRDRALLDLAKPARQYGVEILTPTQWLHRQAPGGVCPPAWSGNVVPTRDARDG